ncbi:hypothetical protein HN784_01590 [bacterium]|jgi:hypothetical protein|nr:hypothetical protein [bacterium]MBT4250955.1 hypothetical protein [bacterium]MBT4597857.1 hypothetical protein [bacterium]MBT6753951.1 hypothetical protein [bacterium]MBT7037380.1 hypothetical protein [bacterium]
MKKNISKEIIATIKKEKIKPIEKWRINLKNYLYWGIVVMMVLLSGAFFSLIILSALSFGPEVFMFFKIGKILRILIFAAPYLWIIAFAVCVFLGVLIFQKTKTGYRHNILFVLSTILLIVSVLGVAAHFSRANERFENNFLGKGHSPMLMKLKKERRLLMPEEGVLVGVVIEAGENKILLKDPMQKIWTVEYSKKTRIRKGTKLIIGEELLIIGSKKEKDLFLAMGIGKFKKPNDMRSKDHAKGKILKEKKKGQGNKYPKK